MFIHDPESEKSAILPQNGALKNELCFKVLSFSPQFVLLLHFADQSAGQRETHFLRIYLQDCQKCNLDCDFLTYR